MFIKLVALLYMASLTSGQPDKCDQTPPLAKVLTPSENNGYYHMRIDTKSNNTSIYRPDRTYVIILESIGTKRPFRWFMITVEDAAVDSNAYEFEYRTLDVGSLKTTNRQSRYSERCSNSVESSDYTDKYRVEIHWISPKDNYENQTVRLRAMVAENDEVWYVGDNLTLVLKKDDDKPVDDPPVPPSKTCGLCSEARYEITFKGQWSRILHPRNYPSKPDENEYSHLIGASHAYGYTLWRPGDKASSGLTMLAVEANVTEIEREIIDAMAVENGTRTLIRGIRRRHPHMSEPSHSLFRVDRVHHLFSVAIAIKPSPDWFLGTTNFELCTHLGWHKSHTMPLYPWDAGVRDGISYESPTSVTTPVDTIDRVAFGSFDEQSPFYQMNLNDLKPFAYLQVTRLEVYPLTDNCDEEGTTPEDDLEQGDQAENLEEPIEEPLMQPLKNSLGPRDGCTFTEWAEWSQCVPDFGVCGPGTQSRTRELNENSQIITAGYQEFCHQSYSGGGGLTEFQECYVQCV